MGAGSSPGAASSDGSSAGGPVEALIDAALKLFVRQGYDATTADQIAAEAGVTDADFARYFTTPESVLLSIIDDMSRATAVALRNVERQGDPERALLSAGSAMVASIAEGRGPVSVERLIGVARVVSSTRNLHRRVSAAHRRILTRPLADWMGVDPEDRRLRRALTMWSAVTASAYVAASDLPDRFEPQRDHFLGERMLANISQSFSEVMGDWPDPSG